MGSMASVPDSPTHRRTVTAATEVPLEAEEEAEAAQPAEVWAEKTQEAMEHENSEEEKQETWRLRGTRDVDWLRFLNQRIFGGSEFGCLLGLIIIFVGDFGWKRRDFVGCYVVVWWPGAKFFGRNLGDFFSW